MFFCFCFLYRQWIRNKERTQRRRHRQRLFASRNLNTTTTGRGLLLLFPRRIADSHATVHDRSLLPAASARVTECTHRKLLFLKIQKVYCIPAVLCMTIYCVIFDGLQTTGHRFRRIFREQKRNFDLNSETMEFGWQSSWL